MTTSTARWGLFMSEATEAAGRLRAALAREPPDRDAAAVASFALSTAAAVVHAEPLLRLCLGVRAALAVLPANASWVELLALLRAVSVALLDWVPQLGAADQAPSPTLLQLVGQLAAFVPAAASPADAQTAPASSSSEAPRSAPLSADPTDSQAGAETFVPLVDDDMLEPFIEETNERLEALAQKLVQLEMHPADTSLIHDIFRDLHTIKGSSGFVGLRSMNRLAHAAEDLVGLLRSGGRAVDRASIDALLGALDGLRTILTLAVRRAPINVELSRHLQRLRDPGHAAALPVWASPPTPAAEPRAESAGKTLRVDFDKLDVLLNLVGELIVGKSRLRSSAEGVSGLARELAHFLRREGERTSARPAQLLEVLRQTEQLAHQQADDVAVLDHVAAELRDQVMRLRMIAIGRIFTKHHRTVRELGLALGKSVRLVVDGADTELDKVLVEQLDDPLLHLVRNAVDHGIEAAEARAAAGKPPQGTLRLNARHRGNQIIIEVSDDGKGIDPAAVRTRAAQRGAVTAEELATLDDRGVVELVLRPGFSTAEHVSELSGRGVGLDVVAQAVSRLKGQLAIDSQPDRGTTFTLSLPLTLVILQVLVIEVAGERYALPMEVVSRALLIRETVVDRVAGRDVLLFDEGEAEDLGSEDLPPRGGTESPALIDLAILLQVPNAGPPEERGHVVLVEHGGARCGLRCDRQLGKHEIVVKSLGDLFGNVPCIAGATLVADQVVLLLDVGQLISRAARASAEPPPPTTAPHRVRILVAEDSVVERESLVQLLRQQGYEVVAAPDGRAALQLAERDARGFDLVTTDVSMPHMDGYELTRRLRAQARHREVPILMLTARSEPLDRIAGFDAGVDEYLLKPADRTQLLAVVAAHLRPHGPRRGAR